MKLMSVVIFTLLIESLVITHIQSDRQWTNFWYAEVFSLVMTRIRHLQHIYFIEVIYGSLLEMNQHLRNVSAWTKGEGMERNFTNRYLYNNLRQMKEEFKTLMEMIICVNRIFRWSQLFNFAQHFVEVTSEFYWVYVFTEAPEFLWASLIVFLPTILSVFLLLQSATLCMKEIQEKMAFLIHDIHAFIDDKRMRTLIMDFSLLIKQSPKNFNANHIFIINFTLMGSMMTSMITFLVIFISFQPKD